MRGRFHLSGIIRKLKARAKTNEEIADLLDCSVSTIKYANIDAERNYINVVDEQIGQADAEFLRVAAVNKCKEIFTYRGWQIGETDAKCVYDLFAVKGRNLLQIQVRSSSVLSNRGWPTFSTCKLKFNTRRHKREQYVAGDFDYWFFYSSKGSWLIPFSEISSKSTVSAEGYDQYYIV